MRRKSRWWTLRVLFKPSCWFQNALYNERWDRVLTELVSAERFREIENFTAQIGTYTVWTENHPYASFTPYEGAPRKLRPKRSTILLAWECLLTDEFRTESDEIAELEKLLK